MYIKCIMYLFIHIELYLYTCVFVKCIIYLLSVTGFACLTDRRTGHPMRSSLCSILNCGGGGDTKTTQVCRLTGKPPEHVELPQVGRCAFIYMYTYICYIRVCGVHDYVFVYTYICTYIRVYGVHDDVTMSVCMESLVGPRMNPPTHDTQNPIPPKQINQHPPKKINMYTGTSPPRSTSSTSTPSTSRRRTAGDLPRMGASAWRRYVPVVCILYICVCVCAFNFCSYSNNAYVCVCVFVQLLYNNYVHVCTRIQFLFYFVCV